jgi:hypothetical protein
VPTAGRRRPRRPRPTLALAAAALVTLLVGGFAASPSARSALLDAFGLRGAEEQRHAVPAHPPPHAGRLGSGLRLGRPVTLDRARRAVDFALTVPVHLRAPDAVWLDTTPGAPARVSLVYGERPGIRRSPHTNVAVLVTEFRATVTPVLEKALGAGTRLTRIAVPGARAYAIGGAPHGFAWIGRDRQPRFEDRRLAGTTLLVERNDGVLLRAEGELSPARVRTLARELARR